ncbi:MAG: hypothetical protein IAG10_01710 [Planctomycetaceae bacterium]|nr:hypothetical protein [Planctomycetaceae bacterium]
MSCPIKFVSLFLLFACGCGKSVTDEDRILSEMKNALTAWTLGEGQFSYDKRMGKYRDPRFDGGLDWIDGAVLLNYEIKGIRECGTLEDAPKRKLPGTKTYKITTVLTFQSQLKTEIKEQRIFVAQHVQWPKDSPTWSGKPWNPTEEDLKPYWEINHSRSQNEKSP